MAGTEKVYGMNGAVASPAARPSRVRRVILSILFSHDRIPLPGLAGLTEMAFGHVCRASAVLPHYGIVAAVACASSLASSHSSRDSEATSISASEG